MLILFVYYFFLFLKWRTFIKKIKKLATCIIYEVLTYIKMKIYNIYTWVDVNIIFLQQLYFMELPPF